MEPESHISSVVVYLTADYFDSVMHKISCLDHAEVVAKSKAQGKIVAVLDTPTADLAEHFIQSVKCYEGVMSTALVYHHVESDRSLDSQLKLSSEENLQ